MADGPVDGVYVVEKLLAQDGGGRRQLRLGLVRAGAKHYLEARVYFQDKNGEMSPTRKGIVFTPSNFLALMRTLSSDLEDIRRWLGFTHTPKDVLADASKVAFQVPSRSMPRQLTWSFIDGGRAGAPFVVVERGAVVMVNFNSQHSWVVRSIQRLDETALGVVAELVASEEIARRFVHFNSENGEFESAFELLDASRSIVLTSSQGR